jgi:hypothetical protein
VNVVRSGFRRAAAATAAVIALSSSSSSSSALPGGADAASAAVTPRAPVVVRVDGGFDWVDAAVGAVAGFGLTLVAGGAILELRRRVSPSRARPMEAGSTHMSRRR